MSESVLLETKALSKSFATPVLRCLDFQLKRGEVHALMGSNGAGKSTLCNIIAGIHQASAGHMTFGGAPYTPLSLRHSEERGIKMVMQELNLFPTMSIAENICFKSLGNKLGFIDKKALRDRSELALARVGMENLNPDTLVGTLGVGQQQLVEIASVLATPIKLLILDEPTAALTDPQIEKLFTQLKTLKNEGVGVIYISHRMEEIKKIADRISFLRDGEMVATEHSQNVDVDKMVELMAGTKNSEISTDLEVANPEPMPSRVRRTKSDLTTVMKIEGLSRKGVFNNINLQIRSGEVLGISGLVGAGRTELLRALFGADKADKGSIRFSSDNFSKAHKITSPCDAIHHGIGMVVEDRKSDGLLLSKSLTSNISISLLSELTHILGVVNTKAEEKLVAETTQSLDIKYDSAAQPISTLSGGNQQKALIARWLVKDLPILLFDEPSRGVDANAKQRIQTLIKALADKGKAVVVVSSETQELMSVSGRIVVMSNGRLAGEFDSQNVTEEKLLEASFKFHM